MSFLVSTMWWLVSVFGDTFGDTTSVQLGLVTKQTLRTYCYEVLPVHSQYTPTLMTHKFDSVPRSQVDNIEPKYEMKYQFWNWAVFLVFEKYNIECKMRFRLIDIDDS